MKKTIVNLTPHILNIVAADGSIVTIPPSGKVARVGSTVEHVSTVNGINVTRSTWGEVLDLPEADPNEEIILVVSRMVKDRLSRRPDVLVPGSPVRDAAGVIIGANGLSL